MPVLSYKPILVPKVRDGRKPHTIRFSKCRWKVNDLAIHATGTSTKSYHNFRTDQVTRVDDITLRICEFSAVRFRTEILINGQLLDPKAVAKLIKNDGFKYASDFFDHFQKRNGIGTHHGQLIQWGIPPIDYLA